MDKKNIKGWNETGYSRNFSEIKIFRKITCDCNRLIINTNTYVDLAYPSRKKCL